MMPAIAPPDNPFFEFEDGETDAPEVAEEVADAVSENVEKVMNAVMVGSTTSAHLWFAFAL